MMIIIKHNHEHHEHNHSHTIKHTITQSHSQPQSCFFATITEFQQMQRKRHRRCVLTTDGIE